MVASPDFEASLVTAAAVAMNVKWLVKTHAMTDVMMAANLAASSKPCSAEGQVAVLA
jgi:hypothetical protein